MIFLDQNASKHLREIIRSKKFKKFISKYPTFLEII